MTQSKCPDPATPGSAHSGARHLLIFFSPHNTVHSLGAPTWPLTAQNHSGVTPLSFLHAHSTQTNPLVSSTPIHTNLARSAQRPDHGRRQSHFLLLPASTAPCPEHFQAKVLGASLGQTVQRARIFFPRHTTHKLFLPSHMLFHPTQTFFPNYPIDWIHAMIYGA